MAGVQWRTALFRALNEPLEALLGLKTAQAFRSLKLATVGDLLKHEPRHRLSGTELTDLGSLDAGDHVAVIARVRSVTRKVGSAGPQAMRLEVELTDGLGSLRVTFFGRPHLCLFWEKELTKGVRGIFVGKVGEFKNQLQMTHPEFVMLDAQGRIVAGSEKKQTLANVAQAPVVGLYPASAKLRTWTIAECVGLAIDRVAGLDDPWPEWVRREADVPEFTRALEGVHRSRSEAEQAAGQRRLRFDEAFATQLTMAHRRADTSRHTATPRPERGDGILAAFDARLPYVLTDGQREVAVQIRDDLAAARPMQRLLQGEVGSGKTVVALRAMLAVVDAGGQAVLLAPTEVLAAQHHATIAALLGDLGTGAMLGTPDVATDVVLLTGSMGAAAKRAALDRIASGEAGIVIGTHALLADRVAFADLGLLVVDEQHRFGVEQRALLTQRAEVRPHMLVLTATPIPRSVAMTIFGDLDVSTLTEIPAGRADVRTTVVDAGLRPAWVDRAWQRVREEVAQRRQVFVVASRIGGGKSAPGDPLGVVELAEHLRTGPLEGLRLGVLHGQLPSEAKEAAMADFVAGRLDVLVSTTIIEVGVDVPNAAMMVVWDAERFGISQLHQLRGRIGRGEHPGVCLLVTHAEPGTPARERLDAVAATRDGFALADLDLQQRREGDVLGAEQSGARSSLRLLSVIDDAELIAVARRIAERAVRDDPELDTPGFADAVTQTEQLASPDWMERS